MSINQSLANSVAKSLGKEIKLMSIYPVKGKMSLKLALDLCFSDGIDCSKLSARLKALYLHALVPYLLRLEKAIWKIEIENVAQGKLSHSGQRIMWLVGYRDLVRGTIQRLNT